MEAKYELLVFGLALGGGLYYGIKRTLQSACTRPEICAGTASGATCVTAWDYISKGYYK